jgi:putative CocE/NonD family hydrolase
MHMFPTRVAWASLPLILIASAAAAAPPAVTPMTPDVVASYEEVRPEADFVKRVAMVPMRDGVKLYTVIVFRKGTAGGPILLSRTPYGAKGSAARNASQRIVDILPVMDAEFVNDGYIRVYQDIRGLHHSEGQFVMNRPTPGRSTQPGSTTTDAYDTIAWLVKNVPEANGKVGLSAPSYLGFTSLAAEINPHPALKAAVPESPMVDGWMGDDWFHNGAFRTGALDYAVEQSTGKAEDDAVSVAIGAGDDYTRYLEAGSIGDYARKPDRWLSIRPEAVPEPGLHRILVRPGGRPVAGGAAADRADDARGRSVGPGGQLWRAGGLQGAQG